MRHLPFDKEALLAAIYRLSPKWIEHAATDTEENRAEGRHVKEGGRWSAIKPVFRKHQGEKCAYCERTLGEGGVDWDVEHYRPKGRVDDWHSRKYPGLATGGADPHGYFLLAYEPENYLACCGTCNSTYKKNFFPLAGRRDVLAASSEAARGERPYLLNPLDPNDPPPESLISYRGISPQIVADTEEGRHRAWVTMEVLGLAIREDVARARAEVVVSMRSALDKWDDPDPAEREYGREVVEAHTAPRARMSACAVAFRALYEQDPQEAKRLSQIANRYVRSRTQ